MRRLTFNFLHKIIYKIIKKSALTSIFSIFVILIHIHLLHINIYYFILIIRNTAVTTIEQDLVFVGNEEGKLIAMRDLVKKVCIIDLLICYLHFIMINYYFRD